MNAQQRAALLETLRSRFAGNMSRHRDIDWADVESRLEARPHKLRCLLQMENTGGEPDVIGVDLQSGELLFVDCSAESPTGRRSLCYDREALEARKTHKPANCATGLAAAMGIEILTEEQYRMLQTLGCFDSKTSSWVATPPGIRRLGGALFCDRRYDQVFLYHNGAQSYYAARGFRGMLRV